MSKPIRIAIVGVGNCASALVQGIHHCRAKEGEPVGLMHADIGGYAAGDVDVVCAFDIDARKVGHDVAEAIFAPPNCTTVFHPQVPHQGVSVRMGRILDGCPAHLRDDAADRGFVPADAEEPDQAAVVEALRSTGADLLLCYLPVGSERAVRFYAECALQAGVGFINNIPVFIASDTSWASRFAEAGLPVVGDDVKAQLGATITHRMLVDLFRQRGVKLDRTYQLNTGGNTDFRNMLEQDRLASKKISKTEAVQSAAGEDRLADGNIHIGPSDYVAWQADNKVCFIRVEGRLFGDVPVHLEMRLSVEDSPNSAAIALDAIRCGKLAMDRGLAGALIGPSACFCKHPPREMSDVEAHRRTEAFIRGEDEETDSSATDGGGPAAQGPTAQPVRPG